jgi:RimJ/RimL family protein N-acetyltransferase
LPDALPFEWGDDLPRLEAARVCLRGLRDDDVPALFAVFSDSAVMRYWSSEPQRDVAESRTLLAKIRAGFRAHEFLQWGVARRSDDTVIGTCTLFRLDARNRRAEVGYALGRSSWGQGLATEAVRAVVDFAFGKLQLIRLEADVDPRNERSLRMLERLGFSREGHLRSRYIVAGEIQDTVFLGLLRHEWAGPAPPGE